MAIGLQVPGAEINGNLQAVQDTDGNSSALHIADNAVEIVPATGSWFRVTREDSRPVVRITDDSTGNPVLQFGQNGGTDFVNVDYNGHYLRVNEGLNVSKAGASENQVFLTHHNSSISKSPMDYTFSNQMAVDLDAGHSNHHMALRAFINDSVPGKGDHVAITGQIVALDNRTPLGGSTGGDIWAFYGVDLWIRYHA